MDQLLIDGGKILGEQGLSGLAIVALVYYVMMQRADGRDQREVHKIEIAEKDKLIRELYDRLVQQAQAGLKGLEAVQQPLSDIATKLRRGSTPK